MESNYKLHVLFVRSGNNGIDPISTNQGLSLYDKGLNVSYFDIAGKGIIGYLGNIVRLRKHVIECRCDLIHAHYSLSGIIASLTFSKKVVCSLMGSDIYTGRLFLWLSRIFSMFFWRATIVKSNRSADYFSLKTVQVIPNGVNLKKFRIIKKPIAREYLGWHENVIIVFGANPNRAEKNWQLFQEALQHLNRDDYTVKFLVNVNNSDVPYWMSAADVLVLTSKWEGSPNVIKEALACSCPIVATKVGDVPELLDGVDGCFLAEFEATSVAEKLIQSLEFAMTKNRTNGRESISFLDQEIIAAKLISLYNDILNSDKSV